MYFKKREVCDLAGELLQETIREFQEDEVNAKVREMKRKKKKKLKVDLQVPGRRVMTPLSNRSSKAKNDSLILDDENSGTDSEESRRVMNMNVG